MRLNERGMMPRTQINFPALAGELSPVSEHPHATGEDTTIHIGWDKGNQWVQVGMEVDIDYARFAIDNPNGQTERRTVMYTPVLSPAELDTMINALRKAKRKAYSK